MHYRLLMCISACALNPMAATRGQPPDTPMPPGLVLAAQVKGAVTVTASGMTTDLKVNTALPASATVNTGPESTAVLVFSNGATLQLGANTELVFEKFLQDPFASTVKVAQMTVEPSRSRTSLALNRGEMVGKVAALRIDRGSSFTVRTPVGVADIRGGTFRIDFRRMDGGQAVFSLSAVASEVRFAPATGGSAAGAGEVVVVQPGHEIKIAITVNANGQVLAPAPLPTTSAMPSATPSSAAGALPRPAAATNDEK